jgi:hypothetical protein
MPDLAPQADDGLDHFVILGLEALGGLDLELDRVVDAVARGGQQLDRLFLVIGNGDRRVIGRYSGVCSVSIFTP